MKYQLIDLPTYMDAEKYENALDEMIAKLKCIDGVIAIYQVGGISSLGISDIDMLVIFEDNASYLQNPLAKSSKQTKYFFTHNLFGTSRTFAKQIEEYTFFKKYRKIFGAEISFNTIDSKDDEIILKRQIAIEYLLKTFIVFTIEKTYRIFKIRNFLLHAKAMQTDLEFLGTKENNLSDLINTVMGWRKNWFEKKPANEKITDFIISFHSALEKQLNHLLQTEKIYFSPGFNNRITKNTFLVNSTDESLKWNYKHQNFPLSLIRFFIGEKKFFNLNNRFYQFGFSIPIVQNNIPLILKKRHDFIKQNKEYNAEKIPYFIPTAYGLNVF